MLTQYVIRGIATGFIQSTGVDSEDYIKARLIQVEHGSKYNF